MNQYEAENVVTFIRRRRRDNDFENNAQLIKLTASLIDAWVE